MKKRTFLKRLEKYNGMFRLHGNEIRTKKEYEVTGYCEARFNRNLCPIEVLSLNNNVATEDALAADQLNIEPDLRDTIMEAADNTSEYLSREAMYLRKSMLRVLGLKENV